MSEKTADVTISSKEDITDTLICDGSARKYSCSALPGLDLSTVTLVVTVVRFAVVSSLAMKTLSGSFSNHTYDHQEGDTVTRKQETAGQCFYPALISNCEGYIEDIWNI